MPCAGKPEGNCDCLLSGVSAWKSCPACGAKRIRCRYRVRPGLPGFNHEIDCRYMKSVDRRRKDHRIWNYDLVERKATVSS